MLNKKIVILATGGTIAGKAGSASDNIGYTAAQVGVEQLVEAIPALAAADNLVLEQIAQIDSKDMSFAVWACLAARVKHFVACSDVAGVVITHGTDTLEETAYFLHAVLNPDKPVVLTCAMRPATSLVPDGPQNVMDAVAVAACAGARGVVAVCAGVIHSAVDVQKVHTYQLNAFSSGDAGALGYIEENQLRLVRNWPSAQEPRDRHAIKNIANQKTEISWPRVEIVMNYAGASGGVVDALVAKGVQGLVLAGTGNGTVHSEMEAALLQAQAAGVRVVRASRCTNGRVLPKPDDAFVDSEGLSPVKARVALILRLMAND
ncbi:MAG: asparaginase [Polaromonas sp.]|nr:asparaginase [Polaromonas sp.]